MAEDKKLIWNFPNVVDTVFWLTTLVWYLGDPGLIPGSERSPGEGNGYPLQDCCLENSIERGAWWATPHRIAEVDTAGCLMLSLFFCASISFKPHRSPERGLPLFLTEDAVTVPGCLVSWVRARVKLSASPPTWAVPGPAQASGDCFDILIGCRIHSLSWGHQQASCSWSLYGSWSRRMLFQVSASFHQLHLETLRNGLTPGSTPDLWSGVLNLCFGVPSVCFSTHYSLKATTLEKLL